jgi:hypothetical protein
MSTPVKVITREEAKDRWNTGRRVALIHREEAWIPWSSAATKAWGHQTFHTYELERAQSIRNLGSEEVWVKPIPSRETTNDDAAGFIYRREPFTLGHLAGRMARLGNLSRLGDLPPQERVKLGQAARDFGTALYIVWSYVTPIAWTAKGMEPYLPPVRYSLTTNQHQSIAATALGVRFPSSGTYSAHEPGTTQGERGGGYTPYGPREGAW